MLFPPNLLLTLTETFVHEIVNSVTFLPTKKTPGGFLKASAFPVAVKKGKPDISTASLDAIGAFGHRLTHPAIPGRLLPSRAYFCFVWVGIIIPHYGGFIKKPTCLSPTLQLHLTKTNTVFFQTKPNTLAEGFMWNKPGKEQLAKIPGLYDTEKIDGKDKIIYLHFFIGGCDWYIAEFDGGRSSTAYYI